MPPPAMTPRAAIWAACAALAYGAHTSDLPLRWVLLEVDGDSGVRVVREKGIGPGPPAVDAAVHTKTATPHDDAMFSVSWGPEAADGAFHFSDPRAVHHERFNPDGTINGTRVHHDVGYVSIRIPFHLQHAPHIDIVEHAHDGWAVHGPRTSKRHHFQTLDAETARRGVGVLQADRQFTYEPQLEVIQKVGPVDATFNVVLLAGCYGAASRAKFNADVARVTKFMEGFTTSEGSILVRGTPLSSQPTNRYFSHFNLFAVWDESPQDGANHPDVNGNIADPRPNRLQCSYGTTVKRLLACNFAETRSLASNAPAADLIVVLVNDPEYGGAGGSGAAYVFTGEDFERVFHHESAHAAAGLSDEYDYEFAEPKQLSLKNCAYSKESPPWQKWVDRWAARGEPSEPVQSCSYSNYFRPKAGEKGDQTCLMRSASLPAMCDVCRESLVNDGFFAPRTIDFALPRCPVQWETLVVRTDSIGQMHVNPIMQDDYQYGQKKDLWGPGFNVRWVCKSAPPGVVCGGGTILEGKSGSTSLTVGRCNDVAGTPGVAGCGWPGLLNAVTGDYVIQAVITDTANEAGWLDTARSSTADFKLKIADAAGFAAAKCDDASTHLDCNTRYGRGTDAVCAAAATQAACSDAACHWNRVTNACQRFFGRSTFAEAPESVGYKICTICDEGQASKCNMSYTVKPQPAEDYVPKGSDGKPQDFDFDPVDVKSKLSDSLGGNWYFILAGAVGLGIAMLCGLWKTCKDLSADDRTHHTACNKNMRFITLILFALLVWAGVAVTGYGVYQFIQTEAELLDSPAVILFIASGAAVFTFSIFVFGAVSSRGKWKLGFAVFVTLILLGFLVFVALVVLGLAQNAEGSTDYKGQNYDDEAAQIDTLGADKVFLDALRDTWLKTVADKPEVVCKFQNEMRCSGFQKSCFNLPPGSSYCPAGCELGNAYTNPCVQLLQKRLGENFDTIFLVCVIVVGTVGLGFLLVLAMFISVMCADETRPKIGEDYHEMKRY